MAHTLTTPLTGHIGGIMVSVLAASAVDRGFWSRSNQTNDYEIYICCSSSKHAVLKKERERERAKTGLLGTG